MSEPWWDDGEFVCKTYCIDDICRNAGRCMWPPEVPTEAAAAAAGHPADTEGRQG